VSLAKKAVRGAAWTIGSSLGARLIGTIGTLLLTHLLAPEVFGEVAIAVALTHTARRLSLFGFGQYLVAHPELDTRGVVHVTVLHLGFGAAALAILLGVGDLLAPHFDAPHLMRYLPGLVGVAVIDRIAFVPERMLVREMHFRAVSLTRAISEVLYASSAVGLAYLGWEGQSIIAGSLLRSTLTMVVFLSLVRRADWLSKVALQRERFRDIFRFGTPMWVSTNANFASRTWDNLLFAALFGRGAMAAYNLAYNLASIPSIHIGEHIGDVLLPSFARMDDKVRRRTLVRSTGLMALIIFPLAVGLGAVADSLVKALFNEEWQGVAPYLMLLSGLSVVRPISWIINSYLQSQKKTQVLMVLGLIKVAMLLACMFGLGQISDLWACAGVGIAFGFDALASMWVVHRGDGIPLWKMLSGMLGPLVACGPMIGAVYAIHEYAGVANPALRLALESVAGALIYVPSAFVFARPICRDFLGLVKKSFGQSAS
jgi:PST family polysaccharide transporter